MWPWIIFDTLQNLREGNVNISEFKLQDQARRALEGVLSGKKIESKD
jgi:hypothetical protein